MVPDVFSGLRSRLSVVSGGALMRRPAAAPTRVEPVFVGEFFASGAVSFAGQGGGGVGEQGVAGGVPAGAGEAEDTDDHGLVGYFEAC